jgi:glycosyltransferase involved in cell wall biosynthesis
LLAGHSWCEHGGFADRATLQRELASASLVVLPSLEDNCPMVVLEAAAAGVPVAGARIGGVPDLIAPGVTGGLFSPNDAAETLQVVESLLADPMRARRLAEEAKRQARQRFHPEQIARRHVEIYRELLAASVQS